MRTFGKQRQLFVDDEVLDSLDGAIRRVMNPPTKHPGNPVLGRTEPWEHLQPYIYGTVTREDDGAPFKMWYNVLLTGGPEDFRICYATSADGLKWEKPRLGIVDFEGSRENNIIVSGYAMPSVLHTPWDPDPSRRYKMLAGESKRTWPAPWDGFFSADGIRWHHHPEPLFKTGKPFLPGDEASAMWDPYHRRYVAFPKLGVGVGLRSLGRARRRSVGVSFSDDFVHWTQPELVFYPDERDDEITAERNERYAGRLSVNRPDGYSAEFYHMYVYPYEGLYLGCVSVFDCSGPGPHGNQDGTMHVQLVASRDLRHWTRIGHRQPFIELGPEGSWDSEMVDGVSSQLVFVGDEIWLYYSGFPDTHQDETMWKPELEKGAPRARPGGVGLSRLRRDGFVSLDADERGGAVTTKPFLIDRAGAAGGPRLWVNASTTRGEIAAEFLDGVGDPLPGFARDDCVPCSGDGVRQAIRWRGGQHLPPADVGPVRLKLHLREAKLYSFWFE